MLIIGVLAPHHSTSLIKLMKQIFKHKKKRCMVFKSTNMSCGYVFQLENIGMDFAVVDIDGAIAGDVFFDVLIVDNTAGSVDMTEDAVRKNITASTIMIYNADVEYVRLNSACRHIGYGQSEGADVSVSSIVRDDGGIKIVYCVGDGIAIVDDKRIEMAEKAINFSDESVNIYHALAAAVCAMVCGVE